MRLATAVTLIYGVLVLAGGILGYARGGSVASIVSGLICGLALLVAVWQMWQGSLAATYAALVVTLLLGLFFGFRFFKFGNWMPAGLMLLLSGATLIVLLLSLRR